MPLFGSRSLPDTSYGYSPPGEATAHGWCCSDPDCGFAEHEAVRRWPKRCTKCNSAADPLFDEPWKHEARGVELQRKLGRDPSRHHQEGWMVWQHRDALRRGDRARAGIMIVETRAYAETQLHEGGWWRPKDIYHGLVWNSLEAGDLEGAANALVHWWDLSDSNSLETNHANRINIQTLVDSTMTFMDAGGGSHPLSAEVVRRAGAISKEALPYLSGFQKAVISRWAAPS